MNTKLICTAAIFIVAVLFHVVLAALAPRLELVKLNFKKKPIPASYGIYITCYALAGCAVAAVWGYKANTAIYAPLIFAMSVLGYADDIFGSRDVGGFAGHFKKLLLEGRVTTGVVKAIGGGIVCLAAGLAAAGWKVPEGLLNGAVIALSANTLNLLDLRPGRACAVFFLGLAAAFTASAFAFETPWPVVAVLIPAVVFYRWDRKALMMMGDSGSNMLGAVLGMAFVFETSVSARIVWLALIVALHIFSEKYSISQTIEKKSVLRWVDRRLGER
jgi:UDP-N-acetylmuramyl pentapeptide phosphotransferase/UDP-N-acetylglucosamine-1-phosphate transferase